MRERELHRYKKEVVADEIVYPITTTPASLLLWQNLSSSPPGQCRLLRSQMKRVEIQSGMLSLHGETTVPRLQASAL